MWLTTRTVWPAWDRSSRSHARFTRCEASAKLSPPGGACPGSRRQAAAAAGQLGLTAAIDDDLRETDFGEWDGFTLEEIQQRWPKAAAAWRRDPQQAPPGGESFADTSHRVNRACDRLLRDHGGQTVLVVSHVTPIKIMLCRALGVPLSTVYRLYLGSACINEIQWYGRGFAAVHRVNDTSHLL